MKVLKIGAVWCNSCNVMRPRWKELEAENTWLETEYSEYDDHPDVIEKYNIDDELMPAFIFLDKDGNELTRLTGEPSKEEIQGLLDEYKDR